MKLKAKQEALPSVRVQLSLDGELSRDLDSYAQYFEQVHGQTIRKKELIVIVLETFLAQDREFQKNKKSLRESANGTEEAARLRCNRE